jgi:hypothetical protein
MEKWIKTLLPEPLPDTTNGMVNALREIIQSLALLGLWRAKFFEHAAFYGGTALRILYGIDRFSEDLDFSLLQPSLQFSFSNYKNFLINELGAYGLDVSFEEKHKATDSFIDSAFFKTNTLDQLMVIQTPDRLLDGIHPQAILKVKLEVDTNPPEGFQTEIKYVFSPVQYAVRSFTLPSLFAGKIHALLFRKWKSRIKGRDWYDFAWYASKYPALNIRHLEARMRQSGHYERESPLDADFLFSSLFSAIENLDMDQARQEVAPFVKDVRSLDIWSRDFFIAAAKRIVIG